MNWSRVKTVLIILFLCTDIFLLATYFTSKYSSSKISEEIIQSTVSVLANNDITIEPQIIPDKMPRVQYIEAENVISDYEAFAKLILGDSISPIDFGYESNRGRLTFYGDRFNFTANTDIYALADVVAVPDEKTAKEVSVSYLDELGFDLKNTDVSVTKTESGFSLVFSNNASNLPVFNSQVTVVIHNHIISSVSGIWFNETSSSGTAGDLKSITTALIDFIPDMAPGTKITGISFGYSILDFTVYHKTSALIPVWCITDSTGNVYYLDARNLQ